MIDRRLPDRQRQASDEMEDGNKIRLNPKVLSSKSPTVVVVVGLVSIFSSSCSAFGFGRHTPLLPSTVRIDYKRATPRPYSLSLSLSLSPWSSKRSDNLLHLSSTPQQQNTHQVEEEEVAPPRIRHKLDNRLPIISRTVPISTTTIPSLTIYELESPSSLVELWYQSNPDHQPSTTSASGSGDPFGVVMWPGSVRASRELVRWKEEVRDKVVLVLGAGTGVEAQAAAMLGAERVIAVDVNLLTLRLLEYGARMAGFGDVIEGRG